jgi:hypothetical protein
MLKVGATVLSLDIPDDPRRLRIAAQLNAPMAPPPRARHSSRPPAAAVPTGPATNVVAYHYEAKSAPPPQPSAGPSPRSVSGARDLQRSVPPPRPSAPAGGRTAWKKSGPTIGKASGLLLLALAGIAILGALFVVFSLME